MLKILHITDQHLNHPKLSTAFQVRNQLNLINRVIKNEPIDMIHLTGDLFDRPTAMTTTAGSVITFFMASVLGICVDHNIKLRVLQGTRNHDVNQNSHWVSIYDGMVIKPDFQLFTGITVFNEGGYNLLAVPDNMASTASKVQALVIEEVGDATITLAMTHGMYTSHDDSALFAGEAHDANFYNDLVKILIMNGHIHTPSLYKKISTGGSFSRLRHNEEEPKGAHVYSVDLEGGSFTAKFIENTNTAIFTTIDVLGYTAEDALLKVTEYLADYEDAPEVYIRLHHNIDFPISAVLNTLRTLPKFSLVEFTSKKNKEDADQHEVELLMEFKTMEVTPITKETVHDLLEEEALNTNLTYGQDERDLLDTIIKEL